MIKFYYNTSPNPMKIALCLEEMDLSYEAIPIDTRKGDHIRHHIYPLIQMLKLLQLKMMEISFLIVMPFCYI